MSVDGGLWCGEIGISRAGSRLSMGSVALICGEYQALWNSARWFFV